MNEKFFTYFKEKKNSIFIVLTLCFVLLLSLFFIIYNSTENKTKRQLKSISKEVITVNSNLSKCIKDLTIDTNSSKEVLSDGIDKFNNLLKTIDEIDTTNSDISSTKDNLTIALNSTINLYNASLTALSNSKSIRTTDDLNKFNNFRETCITDYSTLESNGIKLIFTEENLKYFDNFYNYLNTLIKINRDSDFNSSQKRDFINTLERFNKDLTYLNEDLTIAINKVREDNRDLNVIIDDVFKKEDTYNIIKEKSSYISIPEGCMDIYEAFNEYLNTYSAYLKSIKEATIYEKTSSDLDRDSSEINKNYKNSASKREDALESFQKYQDKLKNNLY